jgi:ABC-type glycerol-3-phosphate transport system permease component
LQFLKNIPKELDEAALLDGASHFRIYRNIILPMLRPAIATVVIIKGVLIYNEFYIPFLYMPSRDLGVVSTALFRFQGPSGTRWEVISAGIVITVIPTLIVFLALQRHIYSGFTRGATK